MADRLADERERGEVEHAVQRRRHGVLERIPVQQVRHDQVGTGRDRGTVAILQVVEDDHLVAGVEQTARDDRADVARAAGDEQPHRPGCP